MDTFWNRKRKKRKKENREKKEINNRLIKDRIIRDIRTLSEQEEKDYYKPLRVSNFRNNNYIEYDSNENKNRNVSLDEYFNRIKPYLRNMIIDFQSSDTWKFQLTIAINFIYSKDYEEERVTYSRSDNTKFTSYIDANEVVDELFKSLRSRYQGNVETSMRGNDFIFDLVQVMYYKCHKVSVVLDLF